MAEPDLRTFRYEIDAHDVIRSVSPEWLAFARENGAPGLTEERVLGRSLWDFVRGEAVCGLYRALFERVREGDTPVLLPFRCDGPDLRRDMRLVLSHRSAGALRLDGVLVRQEPRARVTLLDARATRSDAELPVCSFCRRARVGPEDWLELEDAVVRLELLAAVPAPRLVDALCPRCRSELAALPQAQPV